MTRLLKYFTLLLVTYLVGCKTEKPPHASSQNPDSGKPHTVQAEEVAASEEVARYMKAFKGQGALSDNSALPSPQKALLGFRYPADLALDLVLAEPQVNQPVHISFDHRGRMWVVQYNQYPFPQGLKVAGLDNIFRVKYDKVKPAPPLGERGADKITFFEDTNGDGKYDKATDAITGLNITTSVTLGRGQIWVLSPPYLLAYPDKNKDGIPEGEPVVHLEGFGLEDTHAVANSLRWGPDGWLYGAQGSTTNANVSSAVTKNVAFLGQALWRYHPETKVFELYAEGGGNNFDVEIDEKGRFYTGNNGADRGQYFKQGAYYLKNWGKHGALTNPYAFGYLMNMPLTGEKTRFTHAWVKYEGGTLPARYHGAMIALNPLQSYVQLTRFNPVGSTFNVTDEARILETDDHWFRPVDITAGPDGALYMADWSDSRLSHVDPHDTWHKASGRIYRLRNKTAGKPGPRFNVDALPNEKLMALLSHPNKWFRQQALVVIGDRKDPALVPPLMRLLSGDHDQTALEALWAINLSGGFTDAVAVTAFNHRDPFVRMAAVKLAGDKKIVSGEVSQQLNTLAAREPHPEVRSQLASTARRLPGPQALPIIKNLIQNHDDSRDRDIPLLPWWAIESKAETDRAALLALFEDASLWVKPLVQQTILERLMQRYIMAGGADNYAASTRLLKMAPSPKHGRFLINGMQEGLRGQEITILPPDLVKALAPYQAGFKEQGLALALRQKQTGAVEQALKIISDQKAGITDRLTFIRIFGEINESRSVPVLLKIAASNQASQALQQTALQALQRYNEAETGTRVLSAYPFILRADPMVREAALALLVTRTHWAQPLLRAIAQTKQISEKDVPDHIVRRLKLLNDAEINRQVEALWPNVRLATSAEKNTRITQVAQLLKTGTGNPASGQAIFQKTCGSCHKLFDKGGTLGPELTGYERTNVPYLLTHIIDPNIDIREGYDYYQVITTDGRTLTGTISARQGTTITLQPVGGEAITLTANQIKTLQAQASSLMPERLLDTMTDQQIRDLFAYLMKKS